ncbi:MAG: peptide-methionine (S)-S-oxide reductase MsrA [Candidatus Saccharibacteria bacterium]
MKNNTNQKALLSGGCFWGVQYYFDEVPGVQKTTVGYTGGHTKNPTYEEVCTHTTGHAEAVLIEFDPLKVSYDNLLKHFFRLHDPTTLNRDGPNIGDSYRSAIFYFDNLQKISAQNVLRACQSDYKDPIVTEITPASEFYEAEDYHQKYTERTGVGFCHKPYEPIK